MATKKKTTTTTKTKFKPVNKRKFFPSELCKGFISLEVTRDGEDFYSIDMSMNDGYRYFDPFSYFITSSDDVKPLRAGIKIMKEYIEAYEDALDNIEDRLSMDKTDKLERFKKESI